MIKEKYDERLVVSRTTVEKKCFCDICKSEIDGGYWKVSTSHLDWGNDSCESYEYKDVCSIECLNSILAEYAIDYTKSNTQRISIEQGVFYPITDELHPVTKEEVEKLHDIKEFKHINRI